MKAVLSWFMITFTATNCFECNTAIVQGQSDCIGHDQCPSSKACILGNCGDPCESLCGENTYCTTLQHIPACACKEAHTGNPFIGCTLQVFSGGQPSIRPRKKMFQVIRTHRVDWIEAQFYCLRNNSRLVSIDTMEEFEEIKNLVLPSSEILHYWTSGSDAGSEGSFIWATSGKPFSSSSKMWLAKEPNDRDGTENCVMIETFHINYHGLNDGNCRDKNLVICEYYQ